MRIANVAHPELDQLLRRAWARRPIGHRATTAAASSPQRTGVGPGRQLSALDQRGERRIELEREALAALRAVRMELSDERYGVTADTPEVLWSAILLSATDTAPLRRALPPIVSVGPPSHALDRAADAMNIPIVQTREMDLTDAVRRHRPHVVVSTFPFLGDSKFISQDAARRVGTAFGAALPANGRRLVVFDESPTFLPWNEQVDLVGMLPRYLRESEHRDVHSFALFDTADGLGQQHAVSFLLGSNAYETRYIQYQLDLLGQSADLRNLATTTALLRSVVDNDRHLLDDWRLANRESLSASPLSQRRYPSAGVTQNLSITAAFADAFARLPPQAQTPELADTLFGSRADSALASFAAALERDGLRLTFTNLSDVRDFYREQSRYKERLEATVGFPITNAYVAELNMVRPPDEWQRALSILESELLSDAGWLKRVLDTGELPSTEHQRIQPRTFDRSAIDRTIDLDVLHRPLTRGRKGFAIHEPNIALLGMPQIDVETDQEVANRAVELLLMMHGLPPDLASRAVLTGSGDDAYFQMCLAARKQIDDGGNASIRLVSADPTRYVTTHEKAAGFDTVFKNEQWETLQWDAERVRSLCKWIVFAKPTALVIENPLRQRERKLPLAYRLDIERACDEAGTQLLFDERNAPPFRMPHEDRAERVREGKSLFALDSSIFIVPQRSLETLSKDVYDLGLVIARTPEEAAQIRERSGRIPSNRLRQVTAMLEGARLSPDWMHDVAHSFVRTIPEGDQQSPIDRSRRRGQPDVRLDAAGLPLCRTTEVLPADIDPDGVVWGGGVAGLMSAWKLQLRLNAKLERTEGRQANVILIDPSPLMGMANNAGGAAGAQVVTFKDDESPEKEAQRHEDMVVTAAAYSVRETIPGTGVHTVADKEVSTPSARLGRKYQAVINARGRRLDAPLPIIGPGGIDDTEYGDSASLHKGMTVNTNTYAEYLTKQFLAAGGHIYRGALESRQQLQQWRDEVPTIVAIGPKGLEMANVVDEDAYLSFGLRHQYLVETKYISFVESPDGTSMPVGIAGRETLVMPLHPERGPNGEDCYLVHIGGFNLPPRDNDLPTQEESDNLALSGIDLAGNTVGEFHAIPPEAFSEHLGTSWGYRLIAPNTPTVMQDREFNNVAHELAFGHWAYCSVDGAADRAIDTVAPDPNSELESNFDPVLA